MPREPGQPARPARHAKPGFELLRLPDTVMVSVLLLMDRFGSAMLPNKRSLTPELPAASLIALKVFGLVSKGYRPLIAAVAGQHGFLRVCWENII